MSDRWADLTAFARFPGFPENLSLLCRVLHVNFPVDSSALHQYTPEYRYRERQRTRALLTIYVDTSFFVSLYLPDGHSTVADRRMAERPRIWLTPLHRAEWAHALSQHIFHRKISTRESQQVFRNFERDRRLGLWAEVSFPEMAFEASVELARRHVARLGVRTLDSLHVASALELKADAFWTFDDQQAKLAGAVGFKVI